MSNIYSYLAWRGDLTFQEREFCDVDNIVFADFSYVRLNGLTLPATVNAIAHDALLEARNSENLKHLKFIRAMAEAKRFKNLNVHDYTEIFDRGSNTDFSAVCIDIDETTSYVAYRGTTHSILGWREDFSMSYECMPSHPHAEQYLKDMMEKYPERNFIVGGHSKGGNLAMYAAMMNEEQFKERIVHVYSNDGPGFCKEIFDAQLYRAIVPKLTRIVPEFSVVGALFETDTPDYIVKSEESGLAQHGELTWEVEGDHFVTVDKRSEEAELYNQIFDEWIESATMEQRKTFSKDFFDALEASGARTTEDLSGNGTLIVEDILISMIQADKKTKIAVVKFATTFVNTVSNIDWMTVLKERKIVIGVICFFVGLFFMAKPEFASSIIGIAIAVFGVIYFARKQYHLAFGKAHNTKTAQGRFVLNLVLMCIIAFLGARQSIIVHFSNYVLGFAFLYFAYRLAKIVMTRSTKAGMRFICIIGMVVAFMLGIVPVVTADVMLTDYIFMAGSFIIIFSVVYILLQMYANGRANS